MKQLNNKYTSVLRKKIWPWQAIHLPFWWHRTILRHARTAKCEVNKGDSTGTARLRYSICLAVCNNDRRYIDEAIQQTNFDACPQNFHWRYLFDIGMAFYDLGHRDEGIDYLERALAISNGLEQKYINYYQLCRRLNEKKYWDRRLKYGLDFQKKCPHEYELTKRILAKSYIDQKEFEKANQIIQDLIGIHSGYNTFLAEIYFSKGSYQQAADIFDKYELDDSQDYWHHQFDYKQAVAYFKTTQTRKWRNKAKKIGRRLAWDKFYTLDYLESEGVERIPEIDEVIEKSKNRKRVVYVDKMVLTLKRTPWVIWETCYVYGSEYWYVASIVLALVLLLIQLLR